MIDARGGDDAARARRFEALFIPHMASAYGLALRLTRQPEAAEDVVHDAFLRALTGFDTYRGGDARSWILTIVRRRAFDWLGERTTRSVRSITRDPVEDPDQDMDFELHDPDQPTPEQTLIHKGEAAALLALIHALPPQMREVIVLREIEDLSYRQIAEITASSIGSVMSRLARARARLVDSWRRMADEHHAPRSIRDDGGPGDRQPAAGLVAMRGAP